MVAFQTQDIDRPISELDNNIISIISLQDTSGTLTPTEFSVVFSRIYLTVGNFQVFTNSKKAKNNTANSG